MYLNCRNLHRLRDVFLALLGDSFRFFSCEYTISIQLSVAGVSRVQVSSNDDGRRRGCRCVHLENVQLHSLERRVEQRLQAHPLLHRVALRGLGSNAVDRLYRRELVMSRQAAAAAAHRATRSTQVQHSASSRLRERWVRGALRAQHGCERGSYRGDISEYSGKRSERGGSDRIGGRILFARGRGHRCLRRSQQRHSVGVRKRKAMHAGAVHHPLASWKGQCIVTNHPCVECSVEGASYAFVNNKLHARVCWGKKKEFDNYSEPRPVPVPSRRAMGNKACRPIVSLARAVTQPITRTIAAIIRPLMKVHPTLGIAAGIAVYTSPAYLKSLAARLPHMAATIQKIATVSNVVQLAQAVDAVASLGAGESRGASGALAAAAGLGSLLSNPLLHTDASVAALGAKLRTAGAAGMFAANPSLGTAAQAAVGVAGLTSSTFRGGKSVAAAAWKPHSQCGSGVDLRLASVNVYGCV